VGNICDRALVRSLLSQHRPAAVINFAAESHVDRSIDQPSVFIETNVVGTSVLIEESLAYWHSLDSESRRDFRFLQISTDEVYGSAAEGAFFTEATAYAPNSPYAASKAAADHLVQAFHRTYDLPTLISHCSNNYGPYQFPEKLIPLALSKALAGQPIPIYGDGLQVRDWIHVADHCEAVLAILRRGRPGQSYLVGACNPLANIEVVRMVCGILEDLCPRDEGAYVRLITLVADRPGHDLRYALRPDRIRELGWSARIAFNDGLRATISWYLQNQAWVEEIGHSRYAGQRLGLEGAYRLGATEPGYA
jgi:dTDP-glucose 4,6-dehydratase